MDRAGRHPRIHIPNSIHHVMIRGNNRERIFFGDDYFRFFLDILSESTEKLDHKIIAYCLMSNHAHLLLHIHDSSLSSVMQKINYRYARWLNLKKKRIGHVFQGRYRSLHVSNEKYLVNLCRYIHLNPVAANMVDKPNNYPWSSHQYYSKNNCPAWMEINLMLLAIKNQTNLNYADFMDRTINCEVWAPALYMSATGKVVYNKDVVRNLQESIAIQNSPRFLSDDQVSEIVCRELDIQKSDLYGPSKNHQIAKKRVLFADCLLRHTNTNITSIAKLLQRTHGTLLRQLNQLSKQPEKYFSAALLKKIEQSLSECIGK